MKGARAKKQAEEAAAAEAAKNGEALTPTPPSKPREGAARPGPVVGQSEERIQIERTEFEEILKQMRSNALLGPAAADRLEVAAGIRPVATPQSKQAKDLRNEVADSRKKRMSFGAAEPDVIPDAEPEAVPEYEVEEAPKSDAPEPPELNLNPKQNHMRTDLEMWVMDEIPALFGVDDSEELEEALQEDGQALQITFLIAEDNKDAQQKLLNDWIKSAPSGDSKDSFISEILEKVGKIQELGAKKKKKKKKADA